MSHLVNEPDSIVTEALDGLVRASGGALARLDGFPDVKVVARIDVRADRVAVVSGGGAGHEPAHAGFVGAGLLSAAVCGEIFASPSVDAVHAAIMHVTGDAGCVLIVKNYTGDRLNFGLAAERARAAGRDVEVVLVADDIALPDVAQPRGLAGTLLVHKAAGAAAERGATLAEVTAAAREVAASVRTLGVSLSSVRIPGRPTQERIPDGRAELGLGIHGEPGVDTIELAGAARLVGRMAEQVAATVPDGPVVLLLNNLGGLAPLELGVVLGDLLATPLGRHAEALVGPAPLMTSLGTPGFSISAAPLTDGLRSALAADVAAHTAWPGVTTIVEPALHPLPSVDRAEAEPSDDQETRALLSRVCAAVMSAEEELNALDAKVGDGDTGSTFATAAGRLRDSLDRLPLAEPAPLLDAISHVLTTAMGGSSGVLGSIFFAAAGVAVADGRPVPDALFAGAEAVRLHGGADVGDRTLLDALVPALDALRGEGMVAAADAASAGAAATASMRRAGAGRSAVVAEAHLVDVADPGAVAVAIMFRAAAAR